jgi:aspartokinase-like uncharacterized kinase
MKTVVVKLGGSTSKARQMVVWLAALAAARLPLVIVPGGGPFADQVRDAQRRLGFSDKAAHAMALLAMEQFGHVILDRHHRFAAARTRADIERALAAGTIPVWLPSSLALADQGIEASWNVTSDALAAWLTGRVGAKALLLIKQTRAFGSGDEVASLAARGIVDAAFASMLPGGLELRLAGPDEAAGAAACLAAGKLPGVRINGSAIRAAG